MRITIETAAYNHRRHGRPWIATVTFETVKGEFAFGDFSGGYEGEEGILEVEANPGDIIVQGQKDHRKGGGRSYWYLVKEDGTLEQLEGKADACKLWRSTFGG